MDGLPWTGAKQLKRISDRKDVVERLWIIPQRLVVHARMLIREQPGLSFLEALEKLDGFREIEVGRQVTEPGGDLDGIA